MALYSWPPETLTLNTNEIINDCEVMEIIPERGVGRPFLPVCNQFSNHQMYESDCFVSFLFFFLNFTFLIFLNIHIGSHKFLVFVVARLPI